VGHASDAILARLNQFGADILNALAPVNFVWSRFTAGSNIGNLASGST
jgi:hypothetical protein